MRIGVIAYEMEGAPSGVGRYLEGLLSGLAAIETCHSWHLFFKGEPFDHPLFEHEHFEVSFDQRPRARTILWEQTRLRGLLKKAGVEAVFSPGYSLPPGLALPQVVTLHDLSFEHLRGEFRWREGWRRRLLARQAARRAVRVLADTETMAADLAETYDLDRAKIGVVPLAIESRFFEAGDRAETPGGGNGAAPEVDQLHGLDIRAPYLLCLGSVLPRRGLDLVIHAFHRQAPASAQLVIAGHNRLPNPEMLEVWIEESPAKDRILRLDYVPEEALVPLYAGAEATIYLSNYEGYGLPPLESLAAGTPALASPGMALDDLIPDYPYRAPLVTAAIETKLRELLKDQRRPQVVAEARRRLRALNWRTCAEKFLKELEIAFRT